MKAIIMAFAVWIILSYCAITRLCAESPLMEPPDMQTETTDINKDGMPDITYYHDGKNIAKVEADTNYDGKPDVTVYAEDGKFKSAEADTDYNGKPDKKFNNAGEFDKWLNNNKPEFSDALSGPDWAYTHRF